MKVKDLPERGNGQGVLLYCRKCHGEYSPDRGDYFMADPEKVMRCCGRPLVLVRKHTTLVRVRRGEG